MFSRWILTFALDHPDSSTAISSPNPSSYPKFNSSPLQNDGWKTILSCWDGIFSGANCYIFRWVPTKDNHTTSSFKRRFQFLNMLGESIVLEVYMPYPSVSNIPNCIWIPHGLCQPSHREIGKAVEQANIARGARRWRKWTKLCHTTAILTASTLAKASIYKSLDGSSLVF